MSGPKTSDDSLGQKTGFSYGEVIYPEQLSTESEGITVGSINNMVKGSAAQKNPHTLAFRDVTILQGVSTTASYALTALCIKTVYDLATSTVFGTATNISAAAGKDAQDTLYGKLNSVPKHLFDTTRLQHAQLEQQKVAEEAEAGIADVEGGTGATPPPDGSSKEFDASSRKQKKKRPAGHANGYPKKKGKHIPKSTSLKNGQTHPDKRAARSSSSSMTSPCVDTTLGPTCVSVRVDCNSEGSDTEVSINGHRYGRHHRHLWDAESEGKDEDSDSCSDSDAEQDVKEDNTQVDSSDAEKARIKLVYTPGVITKRPPGVLKGFGTDEMHADALQKALQVLTVRDLALYPPYLAAKKLLAMAYMPDRLPGVDSEAPPELLPKVGVYATEKVFYDRVYMDQVSVSGLTPLMGMVDVRGSNTVPPALPAIGAIVTYEQDWFQEGVALGDLLHSVALAPGESTRVAITSGSRTSTTTTTQDISQTDSLDTTSDSSRAIQDVTKAVASKGSDTTSSAEQSDTAVGGTVSGGGSGFGASGSFTASGYANWSKSSAEVNSAASSSMGSDGNQGITASTHQAAMSSRNRRASAVSEVSEAGRVEQSTRVVANFNHMHALSIQYYEVVQTFRVTTSVSQVCPVVFLPFQLKGNDSWSSPDVWWRRAALSLIMPESLRTKLARAFNMVISLVMGPDKHLALEVPQPLPDGWDSTAASGQDVGTYVTREEAVKDAIIPLELPPIIDREPYNWRLPQRGLYLANIDVDMAWRSLEPPPPAPTTPPTPPTPREQGGSRDVIAELFTWGDTVLKKEFSCSENPIKNGIIEPLQIVQRADLLKNLASQTRLCQKGNSSAWQPWTGFKPSDGTAFMDWESWQSNPDTLFNTDQPHKDWDPWPSPGGDRSRDIPLDQLDYLAISVEDSGLPGASGEIGDNRVYVSMVLHYYPSDLASDHVELSYTCSCALLPGYNTDGGKRIALMRFLPDERRVEGAIPAANIPASMFPGDNRADLDGCQVLLDASRAPRKAWQDVLAELNSNSARYTQALWNSVMSYDAQRMAPVLAAHSYQGMPLLGLVDPAPVALMGRHVAFKLAGSGIMHGADTDVPSPADRSGKLVADYKANQDDLRLARQAQSDFNKAVQRAGTAQEVVNLLRSSAADKGKQGLYPGLAEQVAAADAQAAAAAAAEGEEGASSGDSWSSDQVWYFVPQLALAMRTPEPARQIMTAFSSYVTVAPGRSAGASYIGSLDLDLIDLTKGSLPSQFNVPVQFDKPNSWRLPQKGLYLYSAEVKFNWKAQTGAARRSEYMMRTCIYTDSKWHVLASHKHTRPSTGRTPTRQQLVKEASEPATKKWDSYDVEDESVYLPQRNIAHYKPGNKKPWLPGTGKRVDCIPLDMIDRLEFSTNVPDAVLGENEVYVTLIMRYYGLEDDDAHTQFERTMVFSIDESTPREPKRLVNIFLDRRTDTETMEYDTRDFMKQAMSDALRSDTSAALSELRRQSSRYRAAIEDFKSQLSAARLSAKDNSLSVLPIKLPKNPDTSPFTSLDVWFNVPALACAMERDAARQQLMGSFLNSVCLSPSRRQQPRPDLPSLPSMIYLELNLDIPLATQAKDSKLVVPEPIKDDSWRLPQTGTFIYNIEVDFRWRGNGKTQPKYSCALMLYSWGRQVLSKRMDTSVVTDRPSLQTTRDALISQLKPTAPPRPQQWKSVAHDSVSPDTGAVLPDFPSAKDATVSSGWEPDPSEATCKNMIPLDQIDRLLFWTDIPEETLGEHYVYVTIGLRHFDRLGITDTYSAEVNRVMCFSMDRPLQSRYQRMAEAFLDCRLPGEERTWLNDPFDDNLHRQSEGVRAQWNAALAALNTKPGLATYHQAVRNASTSYGSILPPGALNRRSRAQAEARAADIAQQVLGSGSAGITLAYRELANADKALRVLQAAGADRTEDIAAKEGKQREFRIRAKANWPLWCAVHGLGDGDDTPSTDAIALPTGGVFAEAVLGRFNAAEKMDNSRFWNWNESPVPLLAEDLTPETIQFQSAQPQTAGQLAESIIQQDSIPDNGKFPAFNMATRLSNLNAALSAMDQSTAGGMRSIVAEAQRLADKGKLDNAEFLRQLTDMGKEQAASGVDKKKVFNELEAEGRTDRAISEDLGPRMAEAEELYSKLGGAGGKADADKWLPDYQKYDQRQLEAQLRMADAAASKKPKDRNLAEKAQLLKQRVDKLYGEEVQQNGSAQKNGKADMPDDNADVDGDETEEVSNGSGRARSNAMDETPAGRPRSNAIDASQAGRPRSKAISSTNGAGSGSKQKTLRFAPGS